MQFSERMKHFGDNIFTVLLKDVYKRQGKLQGENRGGFGSTGVR